jgi:hypothetical protein
MLMSLPLGLMVQPPAPMLVMAGGAPASLGVPAELVLLLGSLVAALLATPGVVVGSVAPWFWTGDVLGGLPDVVVGGVVGGALGTTGAGVTTITATLEPVPDKAVICGLFGAFVVIVRLPVTAVADATVGVKTSAKSQGTPACNVNGRVLGQVPPKANLNGAATLTAVTLSA